MLKQHKRGLILSSFVILLPMLVGLLLWDKLPQQITTHWGIDGVADGTFGRAAAVIIPPLLVLAVHWFCVWFTAKDPNNQNSNKKMFGLVLWICPVLSLISNGVIYAAAMGKIFTFDTLILLPIGLMFVVLGNYLPKCTQNYTIGIKMRWTLASEENWNATHRFAGKVWVLGGLLFSACVLLPITVIPWVLVLLLVVIALTPVLYSYRYYQQQAAAGEVPQKAPNILSGMNKTAARFAGIFTAVIFVGIALLCLTGDIEIVYEQDAFAVEASYWQDIRVPYAEIEQIEFLEDCDAGSRTNGFGTPRLSMGRFYNELFGGYTRYSYTKCRACVVLTVGEDTLVLSGKDTGSTRAIYDELLARTQ